MKPSPSHARRRPSLARRALPAIALTGASGFLLSALDRPNNSANAATPLGDGVASTITVGDVTILPAAAPAPTPAVAPAPTVAPQTPETTSSVPSTPVATINSNSVTTTPEPVAVETAPTVASTVPPAPVATPCRTVDGPTVNTRFGPVQVEASVSSSGRICSVDAIQSPSDRRKSRQISQYAVPILNGQVMAAQSKNINGVSGATYTSVGYYKSLQSILDSLGG